MNWPAELLFHQNSSVEVVHDLFGFTRFSEKLQDQIYRKKYRSVIGFSFKVRNLFL